MPERQILFENRRLFLGGFWIVRGMHHPQIKLIRVHCNIYLRGVLDPREFFRGQTSARFDFMNAKFAIRLQRAEMCLIQTNADGVERSFYGPKPAIGRGIP